MRKAEAVLHGFRDAHGGQPPPQARPAWDAGDGQRISGRAGERLGVPSRGRPRGVRHGGGEGRGEVADERLEAGEEWFGNIEDGVARFVRKCVARCLNNTLLHVA